MSDTMQRNDGEIISADEWVPVFLDMLQEGHKLKIAPHGYSMYPFLISDRDEVVLKIPQRKLKRGDVVLYRRENGIHVLHRIHHIKNNSYFLIGDSQTEIEGPLEEKQIFAVAESIIRKGKTISCESKGYLLLYGIWLRIRIIRPFFIWLWLKVRKLTGEDRREKELRMNGGTTNE